MTALGDCPAQVFHRFSKGARQKPRSAQQFRRNLNKGARSIVEQQTVVAAAAKLNVVLFGESFESPLILCQCGDMRRLASTFASPAATGNGNCNRLI